MAVDLVCYNSKLVIEVDGKSHYYEEIIHDNNGTGLMDTTICPKGNSNNAGGIKKLNKSNSNAESTTFYSKTTTALQPKGGNRLREAIIRKRVGFKLVQIPTWELINHNEDWESRIRRLVLEEFKKGSGGK